MDYATIDDIITLFRALTPQETERAEALIPFATKRKKSEKIWMRWLAAIKTSPE